MVSTAKIRPLTNEQRELAASFMPLVYSFVSRTKQEFASLTDREEAISHGYLILCKAARCYDPGHKCKPVTYFYNVLSREFSRYFGRLAERPATISIVNDLCPSRDSSSGQASPEAIAEVGRLLGLLPVREAQILAMLYGLHGQQKLNTAEIAEVMDCSPQWVSHLSIKAIKKLKAIVEREEAESPLAREPAAVA